MSIHYLRTVIAVFVCTLVLGFAALANAQGTGTSSPTSTPAVPATPTVTTPTAPNTGAGGGAAQNVAVMSVSGLIAALGAAYLVRSRVRKEA